ncbi:hypothetical protein C8R44DRAFT_878805 [Mycena epipterygia]|nr:hypothetical protein C8R44DRAFT_878805 [Mycena epipterygia]
MRHLGIPDVQMFVNWLEAEKVFLANLQHEPVEETLQMEYYQKLVNLYAAKERLASLRNAAMELRDNILLAVHELENRLEITQCWEAGSDEWLATAVMVGNRRYQRALDKLHGLVETLTIIPQVKDISQILKMSIRNTPNQHYNTTIKLARFGVPVKY